MTRVYVLIETGVGKTKGVLNAMRGAPGAKSVDAITGPYDVIAVIEGEDLNTVSNVVTRVFRSLPERSVIRVTTCLAVELA